MSYAGSNTCKNFHSDFFLLLMFSQCCWCEGHPCMAGIVKQKCCCEQSMLFQLNVGHKDATVS